MYEQMRKGADAAADREDEEGCTVEEVNDEDEDEGCTVEEVKEEKVPAAQEVQEPAKDQIHQLANMISDLKAEQEP